MNRTLYVHIACVVVALLLPIYVPLTLYAKGGFTFARFPPIICVGTNIDANFYTVIFPTTILYAVGTTMLLQGQEGKFLSTTRVSFRSEMCDFITYAAHVQ